MSKSWNSESYSDAELHAMDLWGRTIEKGYRENLDGLQDNPEKRLELGLKGLPFPYDFREATISLRAIIREKRKSKQDYEDELRLLYWLSAISSFSTLSGFNVIEMFPRERLKDLNFTYENLGYEKLELLSKTDKKWIVDLWGEPHQHTTLHDVHIDIWHEYEGKLKEKYIKEGLLDTQPAPKIEKSLEPTNKDDYIDLIKERVIYGNRSENKTKGKAKYYNQAGRDVTIEEFTLEHYFHEGYEGYWSENDYWAQIMMLLYWDIVYAKLPGVFDPKFGSFPNALQDIPYDLFTEEFYTRRKEMINDRHKELGKSSFFGLRAPSPERELRNAWKKHRGEPCRIFDGWERFTIDDLCLATSVLNPSQLVKIMDRLLRDFNNNRSGLPDLFLAKNGEPLFIEVKSTHEKVAQHQTEWHEYLIKEVGVPVVVCRVAEH